MKNRYQLVIARLLLPAAACLFSAPFSIAQQRVAQHTVDMSTVPPESVGFSAERLERLHAILRQAVETKQIAGIVSILARHGKVVDYQTYGMRDLASGTAMTMDTIFRDYSMTKPVTGVAMMILFEEGKWLPSDPIAKYIPAFAHLKVYKSGAGSEMVLEDPEHPPTIAELMSHTAGFTYGLFGDTAVDKMYREQKVLESANLGEMVDKLGKIPLVYQPGKAWRYSVSMDIEGYIVEKLSGQSLPDFLRDRVFQPLGMKDAGFYVPADKRSRFVTAYAMGQNGLVPAPNAVGANYDTQPTMPSGGGGMVSTAEDYYRFAQMLLNGGELNAKRILTPSSVTLMTSNHLPAALLTGQFGIGFATMRSGMGYGYNGAVAFDPPLANLAEGRGTYSWDGLAGTWFWVDPANDVVFVGMIQRMMTANFPTLEFSSRSAVYGALADPAR
jgi:CubicO group peptidase (beta-lactamase class C family)